MKKNKPLIFVLLAAAIALWANNIYQLVSGVSGEEELLVSPDDNYALNSDSLLVWELTDQVTFAGDFRDPFQTWLYVPKPKVQKKNRPVAVQVKPAPKKPPRLRLSGIIRDQQGILAVIEDPQGTVHFARSGDTISGVSLMKILDKHVTCRFEKETYDLHLESF